MSSRFGTPEQLRKLAQEARDMATRLSLLKDRATLFEMAENYESMAKDVEGRRGSKR